MKVNNVTKRTMEQLNADFMLDNTRVLWAGDVVALFTAGQGKNYLGKQLTVFTADNIVAKITRWCAKNNYRCTQVREGRVWL